MAEQENAIVPQKEADWRPRVFILGGLLGTILGLVSAYFYVQAAEDKHGKEKAPEAPAAGDALRVGISLLSIVRTITEWGSH